MWPFKRKASAASDAQPVQSKTVDRLDTTDYAIAAERSVMENSTVPVSPAQLDQMWGGAGVTRTGVPISERTAMAYGAVYSAVKVLAEAMAMIPLLTYAGDEDGPDHQLAKDEPVYRLLRRSPNPEMTSATYKETKTVHLCLWGNAYSRIILNNANQPKELRPLPPDRVRAERFGGNLRYVIDGNSNEIFAPEEIIHVPGLGYDGIKGLSPIGMARETIAIGKAAELFGATFFGNGTNLGGLLMMNKKMSPENKASLRQSWAGMYEGVTNSHRTAIIDGTEGATYTKMTIPPEDAQFLETRQFQVVEIARLYRVPPHMLGDLSKGGYNSLETMSLEFLTYTLMPWFVKYELEMTRKLFPDQDDRFVRFYARQLLRADHSAKQSYYASGRQWGYLTDNDIRAMEDLPPVKGGDNYLVPVNMNQVDAITGKVTTGAGAAPPAPAPGNEPPPDEKMVRCLSLRGVFEDIFTRMINREQKGLKGSGGNDRELFYRQHRTLLADSLRPASVAVCSIMGSINGESQRIIDDAIAEAAMPHADGIDIPAVASLESDRFITSLVNKCKGTHDEN